MGFFLIALGVADIDGFLFLSPLHLLQDGDMLIGFGVAPTHMVGEEVIRH